MKKAYFSKKIAHAPYTHWKNPAVVLGKPGIKGTRITVELLMCKLSEGFTIEDILEMYLHLTITQVRAAFAYAADKIADEITYEVAA